MGMTNAGKTQALDGVVISHLSLHTAFPGNAGANEVAGGSPAYARKAATIPAASGSPPTRNATGSPLVTFDVPAGTTVRWVGGWDAVSSGSCKAFAPAGTTKSAIATVQSSDDTFRSDGHPFVNGDRIVPAPVLGEALATGLTEGTEVFVISATADTFQVSATAGGAAINLTGDGEVFFQDMVPATDPLQFQVQVNQFQFDINA